MYASTWLKFDSSSWLFHLNSTPWLWHKVLTQISIQISTYFQSLRGKAMDVKRREGYTGRKIRWGENEWGWLIKQFWYCALHACIFIFEFKTLNQQLHATSWNSWVRSLWVSLVTKNVEQNPKDTILHLTLASNWASPFPRHETGTSVWYKLTKPSFTHSYWSLAFSPEQITWTNSLIRFRITSHYKMHHTA